MFNDEVLIADFIEGKPAARPFGFENEVAWLRIEDYISCRWGARPVEWIVQGPGLFTPHLRPTSITKVEQYGGEDQWIVVNLRKTAMGVELEDAEYRITGVAGKDEDVPDDVLEAYTRLTEYVANLAADGYVGATSYTESVPGASVSVHRSAQVIARALEFSGAADILKGYRYV